MSSKETWENPQGKLCPKCEKFQLYANDAWNCLSRRDNKTHICRICGDKEWVEDLKH